MKLDFNVDMGEYLPLREVVFHSIRQAILKGDLKPGERLMEIKLANKLGVSRTPIREAIRKLELEGLVNVAPRRGAEVADISEKNLRDVLEVRRVLEELSVKLACRNRSPELLDRLRKAAESFEEELKKGSITDVAEADVRFHDQIYEAADNQKLIQMLSNLREQMYRFRIEYLKKPEVYARLKKEHEEIIEAISSGNVERASRVTCDHIDNQATAVSSRIRTKK